MSYWTDPGVDPKAAAFVDTLELSVRANRILKAIGVKSMDEFMDLTKERVTSVRGAGTKTWREVLEIQTWMRHQELQAAKNAEVHRVAQTSTFGVRDERVALACAIQQSRYCQADEYGQQLDPERTAEATVALVNAILRRL